MSDISVCAYCKYMSRDVDEEPCLHCAINVGTFQLDLQEHDASVKAEAIDEFVAAYKEWIVDSSCDDASDCNGMCIDCFMRERKEKENDKADTPIR